MILELTMNMEDKMAGNKLFDKLKKLDGAVINSGYNHKQHCIRSQSPSVNWAFAIEGGGIPKGFSGVFYGPPKGGKSLLVNSMVAQLHKDDPEAVAINFNTELRGAIQCSADAMVKWGIDPERYMVFDVNQPELIFDRIEHDIAALCEEGLKVGMVIIDSLTHIQGRRTMNATSVNQQQIGDHAQTISVGLKRILPVMRKYGIALIATDHVRAELDQHEIMRGNTVKMSSSGAAKHVFEFFGYVEPNKTKDGRVSLAGEEFVDKEVVDFMKKGQKTGHKLRFTIKESSFGKAGRVAEFTLDYDKGIINQYEEIYTLGVQYGVIERPNNVTYKYKDENYRGLASILTALKDNEIMQKEVLDAVWMKEYGIPYYR